MEAIDNNIIGKDVFLRLLTTQLQYQDPLAPTGSTEFVAQLAQFTQLEQTANTNETLRSLLESNTSLNNYGAAGLLGKEVQVEGGRVTLSEGTSSELSYSLQGNANRVITQIIDAQGNIVRSIESGAQKNGAQRIAWDGRDRDGNLLPDGDYRFDVSATNLEGAPIRTETFSSGVVTGVVYENNQPYLIVGGNKVAASAVKAINN